jgi:hypothetical protein
MLLPAIWYRYAAGTGSSEVNHGKLGGTHTWSYASDKNGGIWSPAGACGVDKTGSEAVLNSVAANLLTQDNPNRLAFFTWLRYPGGYSSNQYICWVSNNTGSGLLMTIRPQSSASMAVIIQNAAGVNGYFYSDSADFGLPRTIINPEVRNGSFDQTYQNTTDYLEPWLANAFGTDSSVTIQVDGSNRFVRCQNATAGDRCGISQEVLKQNHKYRVRFRARTSIPSYGYSVRQGFTVMQTVVLTQDWQYYDVEFTAATTDATLTLYPNSNSAGTYVDIDEIHVEEYAPLDPYDGNWHWLAVIIEPGKKAALMDGVVFGEDTSGVIVPAYGANSGAITVTGQSSDNNTEGDMADTMFFDQPLSKYDMWRLSLGKFHDIKADYTDIFKTNDTYGYTVSQTGAVVEGGRDAMEWAWIFDGTNRYIDTGFGNGFDPATNDLALVCYAWCSNTSPEQMVLSAPLGSNQRLYVGLTGGEWTAGFGNSFWLTNKGKVSAEVNKIVQVGVVCESGTLHLYIDGVLSFSSAVQGSFSLAGNIWLGRFPSGGYYWNGGIGDFSAYGRALSVGDLNRLRKTRTSIDRLGKLHVPQLQEGAPVEQLLDETEWNVPVAGDNPNSSLFWYAESGSETSTAFVADPWGNSRPAVLSETVVLGNSEGGFNYRGLTVDPTKAYRYSVWINRQAVSGRCYLGAVRSSTDPQLANLNGTSNGNPYFYSYTHLNDWLLIVAFVLPYDFDPSITAYTHLDRTIYPLGVYRPDGTVESTAVNCFKALDATATIGHIRSFMYYSSDAGDRAEYMYPRVDVVDGTEPSVADLISGWSTREYQRRYSQYRSSILGTNFQIGKARTMAVAPSEVGPVDGLRAAWWLNDFDPTTGAGLIKDWTGNGHDAYNANNGNVADPQQTISGRGAMEFVYNTGSIYYPATNWLNIDGMVEGGDFTLSCWVYLKTYPGYHGYIGCADYLAGGFFLGCAGTATFTFILNNNSQQLGATASAPGGTVLGQWCHLVGRYNSAAQQCQLIVNGIEDGTTATGSSVTWTAGTNGNIIIGKGSQGGWTNTMNGYMEDVRVYNKYLSDTEVQALYDMYRKPLKITRQYGIFTQDHIVEHG